MNDKHFGILIELKESMARVEQKVDSSAREIAMGVDAHRRVDKLETRLGTLWLMIAAIPVIGAAVAFIWPDTKLPVNNREYHG